MGVAFLGRMYFIHQALSSTFLVVNKKCPQVSFHFQQFPALSDFFLNKKVLRTPFTFLGRPWDSALAVISQLLVLWEGGRVIMLPYPKREVGL